MRVTGAIVDLFTEPPICLVLSRPILVPSPSYSRMVEQYFVLWTSSDGNATCAYMDGIYLEKL